MISLWVNRSTGRMPEQKLSLLSAREHQVMTGVCVLNCKDQSHVSEVEITKVFFRPLSHREINDYLDSAEWVDKAGGYGIQGLRGITHRENRRLLF